MRKFRLSALFIIIISSVIIMYGQFSNGFKFGWNRSNVTNNRHQSTNYRNGAFVGLYCDYQLFSIIRIQPEFDFIQHGYNTQNYSVSLDYLEIPVILKLKTKSMDFYTGISAAKLINSRQHFNNLDAYQSGEKIQFSQNTNSIKFGFSKYFNLNVTQLSIEARYSLGLKSIANDAEHMNQSLAIIFGFNDSVDRFFGKDKTLIPIKKDILKELKYIMSPAELQKLMDIEKQKDIAEFVDSFWNERDPFPSTPENEFKNEYYSRIDYTNIAYKEGRISGCETDRGRVYILYGPPDEIIYEYWSNNPLFLSDGTRIHTYEIWLWDKASNSEMSNHIFSDYYPGQMRFIFADFHGNGIYKQIYSSEKKEAIDPRIYLIP